MSVGEPPPEPDGNEPRRIGSRDVTDWPSRVGSSLVAAAAELARRVPWIARAYGWSTANLAFVLFAALALGTVMLLTNVAGEVYESVTEHDGISRVDRPVLDAAVGLRTPGLDTAVTWFTDIGGPIGMPVLAGVVVIALAIRWRTWTPVVISLVAGAGSLLMTAAGKRLVDRARPPVTLAVPPFETSPSFPSGHTLNAMVLTAVIVYLVLLRTRSTWQRVLVTGSGALFALAMGLSRVFLGHHWLTDVIAGWALGLAWALAVITAHRLYLTLQRPPGPGPLARPTTSG